MRRGLRPRQPEPSRQPESDGKEGWPVVDGQPTEPYALPDDERANLRVLRQGMEADTRREELERTAYQRGLQKVVEARQQRLGIITFNRSLFRGRVYIEARRRLNGSRELRIFAASENWEYGIEMRRDR